MKSGMAMILACMQRQLPIEMPGGTCISSVSELPEGRNYEITGFDGHLPHEEVVDPDSFTAGVAPNLMVWNGQRHMPVLTLKLG